MSLWTTDSPPARVPPHSFFPSNFSIDQDAPAQKYEISKDRTMSDSKGWNTISLATRLIPHVPLVSWTTRGYTNTPDITGAVPPTPRSHSPPVRSHMSIITMSSESSAWTCRDALRQMETGIPTKTRVRTTASVESALCKLRANRLKVPAKPKDRRDGTPRAREKRRKPEIHKNRRRTAKYHPPSVLGHVNHEQFGKVVEPLLVQKKAPASPWAGALQSLGWSPPFLGTVARGRCLPVSSGTAT